MVGGEGRWCPQNGGRSPKLSRPRAWPSPTLLLSELRPYKQPENQVLNVQRRRPPLLSGRNVRVPSMSPPYWGLSLCRLLGERGLKPQKVKWLTHTLWVPGLGTVKVDSSSALEPQTPLPFLVTGGEPQPLPHFLATGGSAVFFHSSLYCHINFLHSIADAGCYGDQEGGCLLQLCAD